MSLPSKTIFPWRGIFVQTAVLMKKEIQEETCHNFSVLAGRSFDVGTASSSTDAGAQVGLRFSGGC